jgi:hypothetical protein
MQQLDLIEKLTKQTGRHSRQTQFLFELCDFDFEKLLELERKLKNNFVFYCPGDKDTVNEVLKMKDGKSIFYARYHKRTNKSFIFRKYKW